MSLTLTILLFLSALFGLFTAFKAKNVLSILVAIGFTISTILLYLSPSGLFYHRVALMVFSAVVLSVLVFITQDRMSARHRNFALLVSIPFILVCTFKVLQLQGVQSLTLGLYLPIGAFIFYSLDRRVWDHYWAHLLFISLSAVSILMQ